MGSSPSKPARVDRFYGETPVRFSNDLVETLQSSSENDSTRAKTLELHIQSRVQSELQRLSERETQILSEIDSKIKTPSSEPDLDREKVKAQIEGLRKRLEGMPKMKELGKEVEEKREEVVKCLKGNETRPLDCWKQVEEFKNEARRMEKQWVGSVIGREYS